MRNLANGIKRFQQTVFPKYKQVFEDLASSQNPDVLFITCSDSRIVPELITQSGPGELFVYRNAGNIIPPFRADESSGTLATIEYAVAVLGITKLIVCGHSDCGAMKGVLHPEKVAALPVIARWLREAEAARRIVGEHHKHLSDADKLPFLVQENVLAQIENVKTHPSVALAMSRGDLEIHGLYYDMPTGTISAYNHETGEFQPVEDSLPSSAAAPRFRRVGQAS